MDISDIGFSHRPISYVRRQKVQGPFFVNRVLIDGTVLTIFFVAVPIEMGFTECLGYGVVFSILCNKLEIAVVAVFSFFPEISAFDLAFLRVQIDESVSCIVIDINILLCSFIGSLIVARHNKMEGSEYESSVLELKPPK